MDEQMTTFEKLTNCLATAEDLTTKVYDSAPASFVRGDTFKDLCFWTGIAKHLTTTVYLDHQCPSIARTLAVLSAAVRNNKREMSSFDVA
mgnify:FL=1